MLELMPEHNFNLLCMAGKLTFTSPVLKDELHGMQFAFSFLIPKQFLKEKKQVYNISLEQEITSFIRLH